MFDIGFTEIMLIGIVALVVIGPERLPAVARKAGQWIAKLQRFVTGVKKDLASELETGDLKKLIGDQREQINELRNIVTSATKDFESSTKNVVQDAKKSLADMETSLDDDANSTGVQDRSEDTDSSDIPRNDDLASSLSEDDVDASPEIKSSDPVQPELLNEPATPVNNGDESANLSRTGTESGS